MTMTLTIAQIVGIGIFLLLTALMAYAARDDAKGGKAWPINVWISGFFIVIFISFVGYCGTGVICSIARWSNEVTAEKDAAKLKTEQTLESLPKSWKTFIANTETVQGTQQHLKMLEDFVEKVKPTDTLTMEQVRVIKAKCRPSCKTERWLNAFEKELLKHVTFDWDWSQE